MSRIVLVLVPRSRWVGSRRYRQCHHRAVSESLGRVRHSNSQHNNIQVASIVDLIRCHVPLDSLDDDTWDTSAGAKVTAKSSDSDNEEDHVLLLPRPIERVVWVFAGLRDKDSLVRSACIPRQ